MEAIDRRTLVEEMEVHVTLTEWGKHKWLCIAARHQPTFPVACYYRNISNVRDHNEPAAVSSYRIITTIDVSSAAS